VFIKRVWRLALALSFASPARAATGVESLLLATMLPPAQSYRGTLEVSAGGQAHSKIVEVSEDPGRGVRREILDRLGLPSVTIISDGETEWVYDRARSIAWRGEPADPDLKLLDPDEEMDLLLSNYEVREAGSERIAGLECRVLEIWSRPGASEASRKIRRLCVEAESGLVLLKVSFDAAGERMSSVRFLRLELAPKLSERTFVFRPPSGVEIRENRLRPDYMRLEEAAAATALRPRPPTWLPSGFLFESVNLLAYRGTTILHYRYSDGIDALSVFQAPRGTRLKFPGDGPRPFAVGSVRGELALGSGGKTLTWSAGDRFVIVGRVPAESLRRIAESVPETGPDPEESDAGLIDLGGVEEAFP